jgi:hypothetical protein
MDTTLGLGRCEHDTENCYEDQKKFSHRLFVDERNGSSPRNEPSAAPNPIPIVPPIAPAVLGGA